MEQVLKAPLEVLPSVVSPMSTLPLLLVTLSLAVWFSRRRLPGIPPGPPLMPIVGNLPEVLSENQQKLYSKLRKEFGDVFSLYIGNQLVVILNGYDAIKAAFVKNADVFSDRPVGIRVMDGETRGVVGTSGALWKRHRKFALTTLRNFGFGKFSLENNIQNEIDVFLDTLAAKEQEDVDMRNLVSTSVSNIICSMTFGKRFEYNDPEFVALMDIFEEFLQRSPSPFFNMLKFFKYLPFDLMGTKREENTVRKFSEFGERMYKEHLETFDENNIRDYIDAFILEMKKKQNSGEDENTFSGNQLFGEIMDLFQAGTETTATTIRWALLYFIINPELQEKMRSEIKEVIGIERSPSMKDKPNLPYCEATIMEVLRIADIAPIAVPHCTSQDTTLNGYTIPKSTFVVANLDSVLSDPAIWKDPWTFNPDRFIKPDGSLDKPEELIPFSIGRRVCLGESLARMELFLFLTSMIQKFVFLPPKDGELPDMDGIWGLTHSPHPYKLRVQRVSGI